MNRRWRHQGFSTQTHRFVGVMVFLEMHRRILGKEFGKIPKALSEDAFSMAGYCLDAHEEMPAGSTEFHSFGPGRDDWLAQATTVKRDECTEWSKQATWRGSNS